MNNWFYSLFENTPWSGRSQENPQVKCCVGCNGSGLMSSGTTREDQVDGRKVAGLEYEAYESMVQSEFSKLCDDIRARWPGVTHICIHHRLGWEVTVMSLEAAAPQVSLPVSCSLRWVKVGEASVVMAISSPHRHDGQLAIQHCVSRLKATVPIWKKVGLVLTDQTSRTGVRWLTGELWLTGGVRDAGGQLEAELWVFLVSGSRWDRLPEPEIKHVWTEEWSLS